MRMAREKKKKELFLRLASDKILYLSSGAADCLGERAELYHWGSVTALVSAPDGQYHLCRKSAACKGKNLCCAELVSWLCRKYNCVLGARLNAWIPHAGDGVLFFGEAHTNGEAQCEFDDRFKKLELLYHKRYGDRVFIEDNCISFTAELRQLLPQRLGLYRVGNSLALLGEEDGPYRVENRGTRKREAIYSSQLANYCRTTFSDGGRSVLLVAKPIPNGLLFSTSEADLNDAPPHRLDLGTPGDRFVRILKNGALYFSSKATEHLGSSFSLLITENQLALRKDSDGPFHLQRTGYQNLVHSASLRKSLAKLYPDCQRLYLVEAGDLLALSPFPDGSALPTTK